VSTILTSSPENAALHWQTELFSGRPTTTRTRPGRGWDAPVYAGVDDQLEDARSRLARVTARSAYQEALHGRAVIVDIRPQSQREADGVIHPDLAPVVVERNHLEWRFDPRHDARLPIASFDLRVIVLCQEGYTSSLAADALVRLGIHRSTDIVGGFAAWQEAGLPVAAG
jgi:rhodanese-related sulfurtransferase